MLQIELAPDIERRLLAAAQAEGLEPGAYASRLIASTLALTSEKHLSRVEFYAVLARLAARGEDLPRLPDEAYTRESFYQDHD